MTETVTCLDLFLFVQKTGTSVVSKPSHPTNKQTNTEITNTVRRSKIIHARFHRPAFMHEPDRCDQKPERQRLANRLARRAGQETSKEQERGSGFARRLKMREGVTSHRGMASETS